ISDDPTNSARHEYEEVVTDSCSVHLALPGTRGSGRERDLRTFARHFCRIGQDTGWTTGAPWKAADPADTEDRDALTEQRKHEILPVCDDSVRPESWSVFIHSLRGRNRLPTGQLRIITE